MEQTIGSMLRERRRLSGLSLHSTSLKTKMSISQLSRLENGAVVNPRINTVAKLLRAYGVENIVISDLPEV